MKITILIFIFSTSLNLFAKDYTEKQCPVVGNTNSKIFHVKGCPNYMQMLEKNKNKDNRKCFNSREDARKKGFRIAKNCRKEVYGH